MALSDTRIRYPARPAAAAMDASGISEKGTARKANEDAFRIVRRRDGAFILAVADGVGGAPGGARASGLAIEAVCRHLRDPAATDDLALKDAVDRAQQELVRDAAAQPERSRMATTLTAALVTWPVLRVAHVGDSRCYRLRGPELACLTRDHTYGRLFLEHGLLDSQELKVSRWRNVLLKLVSARAGEVRPDIVRAELQSGDTLLLCTDGLTDVVPEEVIREVLREDDSARAACDRLAQAAAERGAKDDVTAVVARFTRSSPRGMTLDKEA